MNKIIKGLGIEQDLSCVVTVDMVLNAKPASDSLMKAADIIQCPTDNIIYVGDDERDIIAGKEAGMITVAGNFGFINDEINIMNNQFQKGELISIEHLRNIDNNLEVFKNKLKDDNIPQLQDLSSQIKILAKTISLVKKK